MYNPLVPTLDYYKRLAPFSAKDLVDSANALLGPRTRLRVSERTLRFYISQKVLPPPEGPPKLARYSFGHLVGLIAIRGLQDRGVSLERARDELTPLWEDDPAALSATIGVLNYWLQSVNDSLPEDSLGSALEPTMLMEARTPMSFASEPARSHMRSRQSPSQDEVWQAIQSVSSQIEDLRLRVGDEQKSAPSGDLSPNAIARELESLATGLGDRIGDALRSNSSEMRSATSEFTSAVRDLREEVRQLRADLRAAKAGEQPIAEESSD